AVVPLRGGTVGCPLEDRRPNGRSRSGTVIGVIRPSSAPRQRPVGKRRDRSQDERFRDLTAIEMVSTSERHGARGIRRSALRGDQTGQARLSSTASGPAAQVKREAPCFKSLE